MLTRLRVSGFKNLVDVDLSFGPFTCIAGANGVGKSNLMDAILFLSRLAELPLDAAALSVRDQGSRTGDIRGLFHHVGESFDDEMSFTAEMVIPATGFDDLGQPATASSTFVEYSLALRYLAEGRLELVREELRHITLGEASRHLPFGPSSAWRRAAISNERRAAHYISTSAQGQDRVINIHQDGGSRGQARKTLAARLPRTVLSAANSAEFPTATLVKREMQSWRLLQLEPSSLREPDNFTAPVELASDGAHLPATLFHLANAAGADAASVYAEAANRVAEIIDDVRTVSVERDERRQLLTLMLTGSDGTTFPARALSDGTLRFLALSVMAMAPGSGGLICLEEPENGIHPERISSMIRLLQDLAFDPEAGPGEGSSLLRQVIVNTHSPAVVMQVRKDDLLLARTVETRNGRISRKVQVACLPGTWRAQMKDANVVGFGTVMAYLNPVPFRSGADPARLIDDPELRQYKRDLTGVAG